jgi:hypothetical protein
VHATLTDKIAVGSTSGQRHADDSKDDEKAQRSREQTRSQETKKAQAGYVLSICPSEGCRVRALAL